LLKAKIVSELQNKFFFDVLRDCQTIDKVGQLFWRGLVAEENRPMKSLNHDTRHVTKKCHKNGRRWGRRRFFLLYFLTAKRH